MSDIPGPSEFGYVSRKNTLPVGMTTLGAEPDPNDALRLAYLTGGSDPTVDPDPNAFHGGLTSDQVARLKAAKLA